MTTELHPLFEAFPLNGEREISTGRVPIPYHAYDGHGVFIGGTVDLAFVTGLLQNENVFPIQTTNGRGIMGIWAVDFTQASLGPHTELQFSLLVSHRSVAPVEEHPLTLLKALIANPDARMFCFGLWNNSETAVAYNRELLGLKAQLNRGTIHRENGNKTFRFTSEAGDLLLEGRVREDRQSSPRAAWSLFRLLGLRQTLRVFSQPYLGAKIVNPISDSLPYNADAQSYVAADSPVIQFYDEVSDTLHFNQKDTVDFDFQPDFVEHFAPFRFVYLHPEKIS